MKFLVVGLGSMGKRRIRNLQYLKAGEIIREICGILGGSGGGRPNIAQGGGRDASRIGEAIEKFKHVIKKVIA